MNDILRIASFTVGTAALATLVMLPPGVAVAWLLARRRFPGRVVLETLVSLPLVLPPVATGFILMETARPAWTDRSVARTVRSRGAVHLAGGGRGWGR